MGTDDVGVDIVPAVEVSIVLEVRFLALKAGNVAVVAYCSDNLYLLH